MTVTPVNEQPPKFFSLAEVAQNNGKDGRPVWIVYKSGVYDVTEYVRSDKHPGDVSVILEFAGRDCTRDFNDAGHSPDAMREMRAMKIGEVLKEAPAAADAPKKTMSVQSMVSMAGSEGSEKKRRRRFLLCR